MDAVWKTKSDTFCGTRSKSRFGLLLRSAPALRRDLRTLACPPICRRFTTKPHDRLNSNLDHPRHQHSLGADAEVSGSIRRRMVGSTAGRVRLDNKHYTI